MFDENIEEILEELKMEMEESLESLKRQFKTLRTGKVTTAILDNIYIDYYGSRTKLNQVATVLANDATTISITPWEKNILGDIEKSIQTANIGVNPNNDGDQIKLFFPPMTVDQRQESVKQMKAMGEKAKVGVRNDRRDANDKIKKLEKEKEITQDESKSPQENIQKITDKHISQIESILKDKEAEILKV